MTKIPEEENEVIKRGGNVELPLWRRLLQSFLILAMFLAILFIPAGRIDWTEGWAFFVAFLVFVLLLVLWFYRKDPELMKERNKPGDNVEGWDKALMGVYTVVLLIMLILAGLDSGRFQWSYMPTILRILGWTSAAIAGALIWWTMSANTYLSESVRIQDDRGHQVITAGPYQYIRHPMYVGVIIFILSTPLILGSLWALIPAGLIVMLFILRTALEDRTLQEKLPGYREYVEQVQYRLLPGIW